MGIPFTQYLLPDGRTAHVEIERSPEVEAQAERFLALGGHFDAEVLRTGEVSFTAEVGDDLCAIEVTPNGPAVLAAVDRLVATAAKWAAGAAQGEVEPEVPQDATGVDSLERYEGAEG